MRNPIGATTVHNALVVVCDDGTAWMWTIKIPAAEASERERRQYEEAAMLNRLASWPHTWVQYHTPIPGTFADAAYQESAS